MGRQIQLLSQVELLDNAVDSIRFERNEDEVIHIQSQAWRIELTAIEFGQWCEAMHEAEIKLREIKGL